MALMKFREQNHIKRVGVRPGHDGTEVAKTNSATNGVAIVHTVSNGLTLYLCTLVMGITVLAAGGISVYIRNDTDVFVRFLMTGVLAAGTSVMPSQVNFWPPQEIPEKYDIVVQSLAAGLTTQAHVFGWEE